MKICVCTPVYSGLVNLQFMMSLMETIQRVKKSECMFYSIVGSSILPMARNSLVAKAMSWGADKIVFIDDDISWKSDDFQRLILHPVPIAAGVYQKRPHDPMAPPEMAVSSFPEGMHADHRGLIEVDGAATGFMRVDREVFEALKPCVVKLYDHRNNEDKAEAAELYEYFAYGKMLKDNRTAFEGEDFNFCRKARSSGFRTFVDPSIKLGHHVGQFRFGAHLTSNDIL